MICIGLRLLKAYASLQPFNISSLNMAFKQVQIDLTIIHWHLKENEMHNKSRPISKKNIGSKKLFPLLGILGGIAFYLLFLFTGSSPTNIKNGAIAGGTGVIVGFLSAGIIKLFISVGRGSKKKLMTKLDHDAPQWGACQYCFKHAPLSELKPKTETTRSEYGFNGLGANQYYVYRNTKLVCKDCYSKYGDAELPGFVIILFFVVLIGFFILVWLAHR